jgi:hypothetical protein
MLEKRKAHHDSYYHYLLLFSLLYHLSCPPPLINTQLILLLVLVVVALTWSKSGWICKTTTLMNLEHFDEFVRLHLAIAKELYKADD